jgi:hypothetical protein
LSYEPISPLDLYEAFYISENQDNSQALLLLSDLKNTIQDNHFGFISKIEAFLESKADELHICPKCFQPLQTVYGGQEICEYQGFEASENQYSVVCTECDYSKEIDG